MYVEGARRSGEVTAQERRNPNQTPERLFGHVVQCNGSSAVISTSPGIDGAFASLTVGKLITIQIGAIRLVGLIASIQRSQEHWVEGTTNPITLSVELIGEVRDIDGKASFDRGITEYPYIGAPAHQIRTVDLRAIYALGGRRAVRIGNLSQDETIDAVLAIDDVLSRHFAIVGTTGVGKSSAVTLLLRKTVLARPDLSVLLLDPHNEFAAAMPDLCSRMDANSLDLPFWLFRLEELAEVLYRGRDIPAEELDLLRDIVIQAKYLYREPASTLRRRGGDASGITADTPIPYRMIDVLREIDARMGALDAKVERPYFRQLRMRLETTTNDPLYRFMFNTSATEDTVHEMIGRIFRVPNQGRPITCFEMAGLPSEVVNAVCSVLARLAFDLAMWSEGRLKILVMCEEAHRYIPADATRGFAPTRHALARIAREGRKYGCYLGVITQRPGDLDPTVLSQCSTIFAMRLANEVDQAIIRSATADASASTLAFLPALGQREAIAFGEGVAATMRLRFEMIPEALLPGKTQVLPNETNSGQVNLQLIVEKMRNVSSRMGTISNGLYGAFDEPAETITTSPGGSFFTR